MTILSEMQQSMAAMRAIGQVPVRWRMTREARAQLVALVAPWASPDNPEAEPTDLDGVPILLEDGDGFRWSLDSAWPGEGG